LLSKRQLGPGINPLMVDKGCCRFSLEKMGVCYNFPMGNQIILGRPAMELIKERYSCRTFAGGAPEAAILARLEAFMAGLESPFAGTVRFGIIDNKKVRAENLFSAGSYGMIKGVRFYLSALVRKDEPRRWETAGFALETAVLFATSLGLGSCWIGGIFDRRNFGRALGMGEDELLPAVVALGWPADRRTLRDRLVRWSARGNLRKSPGALFFAGDWRTPLAYDQAPQWGSVLESVRLAPSASNKQPWRIIRLGDGFHFYLARNQAYGSLMPFVDLQRIDMGIAMCHFQLAAAEAGLKGGWVDGFPELPATPKNFEYIVSFVTC